jgi:hypothetical protein
MDEIAQYTDIPMRREGLRYDFANSMSSTG